MESLRALGAGEGTRDWPPGWEARWDYLCDVLLVVGPSGQNFRITRQKLEQAGSLAAVKDLMRGGSERFLEMFECDETAEWLRGVTRDVEVEAKGNGKVGVDVRVKGRVLDLD